jgi:hypothetical protein
VERPHNDLYPARPATRSTAHRPYRLANPDQ